MTKGQWARMALLIDGLWKDSFDQLRAESYYTVLAPYDAVDVYAAVLAWTDEERAFAPSIGELKSRLTVSVSPSQVPPFEQAMATLRKVAARFGMDGEKQGLRALEVEAPFLAYLAKRISWGHLVYRKDDDYPAQVYRTVASECVARREDRELGAVERLSLPQRTAA